MMRTTRTATAGSGNSPVFSRRLRHRRITATRAPVKRSRPAPPRHVFAVDDIDGRATLERLRKRGAAARRRRSPAIKSAYLAPATSVALKGFSSDSPKNSVENSSNHSHARLRARDSN